MDLSNVDYSGARFWMDMLQLAAFAALGLYTHIASRSKANRTAINALREDVEKDVDLAVDRVNRCERHLDVLESRMNSAPTHADLGRIYARLNTVAAHMERLSGQMGAVAHQLQLVNEYLLNNKGGSQ
jgi:flagellin-like hook-associated protein FlgL